MIETITKGNEKRTEKERVMILNLLSELNFFKYRRPMDREDLVEVANMVGYRRVEPGDYLFK